jgi:hypothetical protein
MATSPKMSADQIKLRQRNIYIKGRIPEVRDELKKIEAEKRSVVVKAKDVKGDDLKKLNHRRIFLVARIEALRQEQRNLTGERRAVAERIRRSPAAL